VLFLMMVLITAACSQTTAPNATTSATATSAAATPEATSTDSPTAAPEVDPFGKYDPPITVKVVRILDSTTKFDKSNPDTESLESNVWSKAYEEMLGIKLEYLWTPSGDQYDTKWTTAIASNDLPDMAAVDATVYKSLVKGGLVQDMTDVFDKYASDYYKEQVEADQNIAVKFMTFDGKLLGAPLTGATPDGVNLLFIRKDWLDKVNMTPPKTIDDLLQVAKAFKDAKLGGDNTVGISMGPYVFSGQCDWEGFLNGCGAFYGIWLKDASGNLVYSTVQPEMRNAIQKLRQAYLDGLINTDFAVNGNATENIVSDKAGIMYGTYWAPIIAIQDEMNKNPDSQWLPLPLPTLDGSPMKTQAWGDGLPTSFFFVKNGYEYPEAAIKIVNLGFKLDTEQYMKYNFNQPLQIQVQAYRIVAAWEPWRNMNADYLVWDALKTKDTSKLNPGQLDSYNNILAYRAGTLDRSKVGYMLINEEQDSTYSIIDGLRKDNRIVLSEYKALPTDLMTQKQNLLDTDLYTAIVKVIAGEDISVYDAAVDAWKAGGGDDITKEVNDWYAKNK